ncbi:MAG: thiol:disulfide interchange protein DsbA/DsbL [Gammaproteobacteria bacterium]|nr:MAG: thiol:disulfide interchange protein DsbA/DsbL [Gammaproteobacteria bacterium]
MVSHSIASKTALSAVLAVCLFTVAAFVFTLRGGGDPTPAPVEPEVTNIAQTAVAEVAEPASIAAEPTSSGSEERRDIVLAQADSAPASGRFELGTHYQRFPAAQGTSSSPDLIEVAEIFWYGCPHCYTFDPYLENWRKNLPDDVSFVRIPAVWNSVLQIHARAFYTAEALDVVAELHSPIFREIHNNQNSLDSQEALAEFFGQYGVEADAFNAAYESFAVNTKLNRADELSRRYRIASVPTVVINGKYTTDAGMAGGYDELIDLIDDLVATERADK